MPKFLITHCTVFLILVQQIVYYSCLSSKEIVDLNGEGWILQNRNQSISVQTSVPAVVQTALFKAGRIPDPYFRDNDVNLRWITKDDWTFKRTFIISREFLQHEKIHLICHGLDTVATIFVNGKIVGKSDNMFRKWEFEIKKELKEGQNEIEIQFMSAVNYAKMRQDAYPYIVPHDDNMPVAKGEPHRNMIRKEQCSFSWDWAPCFAPSGIWLPIEMIGFSDAIITSFAPKIFTLNLEKRHFKIKIMTYLTSPRKTNGTLFYTIKGISNQQQSIALEKGENEISFEFEVQNQQIQLWYPIGYGDQPLYDLHIRFESKDGCIDQMSKRIGFRKVELIQTPIDSTKNYFYFRINDIPIFAKGANFVPIDSFEDTVTKERLQNLIQSSVDANMNMLRVWGGGIYQHDAFYDLCDEKGLLVWQEFMFACSMYPTDKDFLHTVSEEIKYQMRRLMHHPSIVIWGGNNENEQSLWRDTWYRNVINSDNKMIYVIDYAKLYFETMRPIVEREDPTRPFWHSSPSDGVISYEPFVGVWTYPSGQDRGDVHSFDYSSSYLCDDVTKFPNGKFMSEYGWHSMPSFHTLRPVSIPEDWDFRSPIMEHRNHRFNGTNELTAQINLHFPFILNKPAYKRFRDYIYLSQCIQSLCMKAQSEHYRRGKGTHAKTMGALYWQLNDIWPAPSWSSIEYGGRWKMFHYFAKRFFAPLLISAYEENNVLHVHLTSDLMENLNVNVVFEMIGWNGQSIWRREFGETLTNLESREIFSKNVDEFLRETKCISRVNCLMVLRAISKKGESENVWYPIVLKHVQLPNPVNFKILNITKLGRNVNFDIVSDQVAPYTFLEVDIKGRFSDNGFLLLKGRSKSLSFYGWEDFDFNDWRNKLEIRSMQSIYEN